MSPHILVFIDWYLPGTSAGGPVRSVANVADHLGGEFHFSILTRNSDYCSSEPYPGITPDGWTVLNDHSWILWIFTYICQARNSLCFSNPERNDYC